MINSKKLWRYSDLPWWDEKKVWRVNTWIGENAYWFIWLFFTVSVGLQQFPATEPAAFGAFWVSLFAFFIGAIVTGAWSCDYRFLLLNIAIQILGIAIQVLLIVFYWDTLEAIDNVLRAFRGVLVSWIPGATHLLPMRLLWGICTSYLVWSIYRDGKFFNRVGKRLW